MNKVKILTIAIPLTIILFIGLVFAEKKLSNYTPTGKVVYCIKDINRKDKLDVSSFTTKDVPITQITEDCVTNINDIKGMYAKENIYSNEILKKRRTGTQQTIDDYSLNVGEVETALSFQNLDDAVGGSVRKDDMIDIVFTNNAAAGSGTIMTKTLIENIKVLDVKTSAGKSVDREDKETPANVILIAVKPEDAHLIENMKQTGKIKLLKKNNSEEKYNPITVENGLIIGK